MAEISATTPAFDPPPSEKVDGRHRTWIKPGQVLNPYGNTAPLRSFAAYIRRQTGNGEEIAQFWLKMFRGELIRNPGKVLTRRKNGKKVPVSWVRPTVDQRMQAAAWLADRGWGKAKETIELTGEASPAQRLELLRRMSEEDRAQLKAIVTRMLEAKPQESNGPTIPADSNTDQPEMPDRMTPEAQSQNP